MKGLFSYASLLLAGVLTRAYVERAAGPFLAQVDNETWVIGNELWNLTQQRTYGVKLFYKERDLVGDAVGHYVSYNGAASNLNWTSASIASSGTDEAGPWIDVSFSAIEGDMHWVIHTGLAGAYQYFVNRAVPVLGEFRTLWRLDNTTFPRGRTSRRDEPLPPLSDYRPELKVQDETWLRPDGSGYITKYDFSAFVREQTAYGVYGEGFGSWYINPGKDYYNGNHLKQELMVHRESATGDAVQLNMIHGTHFQVSSSDAFPVGKIWGPWLWYLNDGSAEDAEARAQDEFAAWPYTWFEDDAYQSRGTVSGRLVLSDGRPAAHAAVFLGDNSPNKTALDMGSNYYYTGYADADGNFAFSDVRAATYGLQAWSNGSAIAGVTTSLLQNDVTVAADEETDLGEVEWTVSDRAILFQVGDFDRYAYGFKNGGAPHQHALVASCPASLTYTVGSSQPEDWCFGQSWLGNWTIRFEVPANASASADGSGQATLIVSLAGYSTGTSSNIYANDEVIGNLTSGTPQLLNDPGLYRSATVAGEWRYFEKVDGQILTNTAYQKRMKETMAAKTIIVTGAGRGIGLAISQYLLQNSHKVVLVARTETELEALKKQYPAQVEYLAADLTKLENATKVTDLAVKLGGKVDGIVINHGALEPIKLIADSAVDEWKTMYDINFFSPLALVQAVIPQLRQTKGRIIVTSSGAATKGYKAWGPYGSSKAALHSLVQHLAVEEKDIVSVSLSPGRTDTGMQKLLREQGKGFMDDKDHASFVSAFEEGKLNPPEGPGNVIAKLALDGTLDLSGKFLQ
ncbi:hypothetical protein INS49_001356 [Diaporthe citri]|uniref:uncharacterized protein n=1 Tax=Diaporthe citri TaxID=83186 RepID=UPI001C7E26B0|nr:uncharacterized protein INS49_001356 [Diaporthe citri]KAG6367172.1 hypothetical protein INS49_001356 [Diaporthe citri]